MTNPPREADELYQKLHAEPWIQPWLDEEELYPGDDWDLAIEKAVEKSDVVLVCLSNGSINKRGYVQKELRFALDIALEMPEEAIFIIPLRLEECTPPRSLRDWQYADYFEGQRERALQRLLISLKRRADSLGLIIEQPLPEKKKSLVETNLPKEEKIIQEEKPVTDFERTTSNAVKSDSDLSAWLSGLEEEPKESAPAAVNSDLPVLLGRARSEVLNQAKNELDRGDIPAALDHYGKLIKKGKYLEETIHDLRESTYRYPVEVGIWQTLGDAYMRANRLKEALVAYNEAEELQR